MVNLHTPKCTYSNIRVSKYWGVGRGECEGEGFISNLCSPRWVLYFSDH